MLVCPESEVHRISGLFGGPTSSPVGAKYGSPGRQPWGKGPHPAFGTPLPRGRERGRGRGKASLTARAVGYFMPPATAG